MKIMVQINQYIGKSIDAIVSQKVKVFWKKKDGKDEVCLVND